MTDFKVGDKVWFFSTGYGCNRWGEQTVVYPHEINLTMGTIVYANEDDDLTHIYVDGESELVELGFSFLDEKVFKTKEDALERMRINIFRMENDTQ